MKRFYFEKEKLDSNYITLDGGEISHLSVLRISEGDKITCFCGDEYDYNCTIQEIGKKRAILRIDEKIINNANPKTVIDVFQALPKSEKLELITQKLTELGVSNIYPFESDFTIAKRNDGKIDRINKIAVEACKQCGRSIPLIVHNVVKFNNIIEKLKEYDCVIFAYEKSTKNIKDIELKGKIAIVVGSEGGFSENEVNLLLKENIESISLGSRILRTETASITLAGFVMLSLGDKI